MKHDQMPQRGRNLRSLVPCRIARRGGWLPVVAGAVLSSTGAAHAFQLELPRGTSGAALTPVLAVLVLLTFVMKWSRDRVQRKAQTQPAPTVEGTDWAGLVKEAARFFTQRGLVAERPLDTWPEAADLVVRKGARSYLVHARHWRAVRVDAPAVYLLIREVARCRADGGILLCARDAFTPAARQLARQNGMLLLDSARMQREPRAADAPVARPSAATTSRPATLAHHARSMPSPSPSPVALKVSLLRAEHGTRGARRGFMPTVPMDINDVPPPANPPAPA